MKLYFILLFFALLFLVVASGQVVYDNPHLPRIVPAVVSFDNNTANVNNSEFLQGFTPQDFMDLFVNVTGDTMTGNLILEKDLNVSGNIHGSRWEAQFERVQVINLGSNAASNLVYSATACSTTRGLLLPYNGSFSWVTFVYDVDVDNGGDLILQIRTGVTGTSVIEEINMTNTVANGHHTNFTQVRGLDNLTAGNLFCMRVKNAGGIGTDMSFSNVMLTIGGYYDQ